MATTPTITTVVTSGEDTSLAVSGVGEGEFVGIVSFAVAYERFV